MQRIYSRPQSKQTSRLSAMAPFIATGLGLIAVVLLIPSSPNAKPDARIFSEGLAIQIDRTSPAFAALEDSISTDVGAASAQIAGEDFDARNIASTNDLSAGKESVEPLVKSIVLANSQDFAVAAQIAAETTRRDAALQAAAVSALQELMRAPQLPVEHPVQKISLSDLKMNRDEFAKSLVAPIVTVGHKIQPPPPLPTSKLALPTLAQLSPPRGPSSSHEGTRPQSLVGDESIQSSIVHPNSHVQQIVIAGSIEFTGGVALTNSTDRVVVFREDESESLEPGAVWIREGRYEIFVDRPIGRLVAELRATNGEVLGRGIYELEKLPPIAPRQYRAEGVGLKIGPVPHGISGRIVTAAIGKVPTGAAMNTQVQLEQTPLHVVSGKEGKFEEPTLIEGSSVIIRADRPGHWGTLAFAQSGQARDITIFADSTMRSILQAAHPQNADVIRASAFVWGRVTRSGRPVAGARVEVMTSSEEMKPIYFNALMIPDSRLTATTENGLYAFFPLSPGAHAVQAFDTSGMTEPMLFPADAHTVSQVDLELAIEHKARVRVFDAFKTDYPLSAEIVSAGRTSGKSIGRSGQSTVSFTGGIGQLVLDTDAGQNYDRVRLMVQKDRRTIDIPMIQSAWLDGIRGAQRISKEPGSGVIVGFVQGAEAYRVALDEESLKENTRIFYFDHRGQITKNDYGTSGGGFIIFNLAEGFRTVFLQPSGTTKSFASSLLVDSKVTNVVTRNLRQ